jgi:hypothetical protein
MLLFEQKLVAQEDLNLTNQLLNLKFQIHITCHSKNTVISPINLTRQWRRMLSQKQTHTLQLLSKTYYR